MQDRISELEQIVELSVLCPPPLRQEMARISPSDSLTRQFMTTWSKYSPFLQTSWPPVRLSGHISLDQQQFEDYKTIR